MANMMLSAIVCRRNMEDMQARLEARMPEEPNQLMEQLRDLAALLASSALVVASLNFHLAEAKLVAVKAAKTEGYSPAMAKTYIEGITAEIAAEYKLAERQNACIVHAIDAARSILSYCKQENFASQFQRG